MRASKCGKAGRDNLDNVEYTTESPGWRCHRRRREQASAAKEVETPWTARNTPLNVPVSIVNKAEKVNKCGGGSGDDIPM